MSSIKISALPEITSTGLTISTVVASVDSLSTATSKVTLGNLFNNNVSLINDQNPGNRNTFISAGSTQNSPSLGSQFQGSTTGGLIVGNGVINNSNDSVVMATVEAAGGNWSGIDGGNINFMVSAFRSRINTSQETAVIASQDAYINNVYDGAIIGCAGSTLNGGPGFMAANQGGTVNNNRAVMLGSEGATLNSNMSGIYNSFSTTVGGNLYNISIGNFQGQISDLGGAMENAVLLGTRSCQVDHQGSSIISATNQATVHESTLHTESLHTYRQNSTEWRDGGDVSGNINVNLDTGNLFSFRITGNLLTVDLTNARKGGEYEFFVENTGSFTINTMVLDGNAGSVFSAGGSLNPTNNGYSFYRLRVIDDGLGGLRGIMKEFLNYSAV